MKANDLLFRIKELAQTIQTQLPVLNDTNSVENIKKIAEVTRQSSEMHQRLIMLETLIHRETGFQSEQNAAVRNFLKELKQVVAVAEQDDAANQQFIQFVPPVKAKEELASEPESSKVIETTHEASPVAQQITPPPVVQKIEIAKEVVTPQAALPSKVIVLAINDRFRIMNELFAKQAHKLDEHIQILNTMEKPAALNHWRSLSLQLNWDEELEIVKTFKSVIFNRYV